MLRASIAIVAGLSILFALSRPAHGASIGVNFAANGSGTNLNLAPADVTGVVPQANWNNAQKTLPVFNQSCERSRRRNRLCHDVAPSSNFHLQLVASASQYVAGRRNRPERHGNCSDIEHSIREVRFVFVLFRNCFGRPHGAIFFERPIDSRRSRCEPDLRIATFVDSTVPFGPGGNFVRARNVTGSALTFGGVFDPDFIVPLGGFQESRGPRTQHDGAGRARDDWASHLVAPPPSTLEALASLRIGPVDYTLCQYAQGLIVQLRYDLALGPDCRASRPRRLGGLVDPVEKELRRAAFLTRGRSQIST